MPNTTTPADDLDLDELEAEKARFDERRAVLSRELSDLRKRRDSGENVRRDVRRVERKLDDLEDEVIEMQPTLHDARAEQSARIARAAKIDRLRQQVAVLDDVMAFQHAIQKAAERHLEHHLGPYGFRGASGLSRYSSLARDLLRGPLHLNGSSSNAAGQVAVKLDRARRELDELLESES